MGKRHFLAFLFALAAVFPAAATSVLPVGLDQMVETAAVAFEGTCTGNRTERDPATKLVATYTTFAVHDVLKGQAGATYEIKQIGGAIPGGLTYRVDGVPRFEPGQDYIVFLPGVSAAGFSSPVGLEQGRFVVTPAANGREVANGRDFRDLTAGIPSAELPPSLQQQAKRAGSMRRLDIDEFKQLVRSRVRRSP
jgi:hypothetical protein